MDIRFTCPQCGKKFLADEKYAGRKTKCTACGVEVTIPAVGVKTEIVEPVESSASSGPIPAPVPMVPSPPADTRPCPHCGETIKAAALLCRFCGVRFDQPQTAPVASIPASPRKKSSPTVLWILLGVLGGLLILCSGVTILVWPKLKEGFQQGMRLACEQSLHRLYTCATSPEAAKQIQTVRTGGAFWREVARTSGDEQAIWCPSRVMRGDQGVSFRGPKMNWNEIPPQGIVGCDKTDNHVEGINILFKNGTVQFAAKGTSLYEKALSETEE